VGFAFRPLARWVFGKIGDQAGRKGAFLATVLLMGGATFAIALLPTYSRWNHLADPADPAALRARFRLGGNMAARRSMSPSIRRRRSAACRPRGCRPRRRSACSGAAGDPADPLAAGRPRRPEASTPGAGGSRSPCRSACWAFGLDAPEAQRKPAFARMKADGEASQAPYAEAFGQWKNLKLVRWPSSP